MKLPKWVIKLIVLIKQTPNEVIVGGRKRGAHEYYSLIPTNHLGGFNTK